MSQEVIGLVELIIAAGTLLALWCALTFKARDTKDQ